MNTALGNLFKKLQLTEGQSVFLFKENGPELLSIISKETSKKLEIIKPDAIYIFNKQPYMLFFDLTKKGNQDRISEIHKQVWSFDQAPLIIFVNENSEEYYNAFDFDKKTGKLSEILDKKIAEEKCGFWNLQSGETLEWFYTKYKNTIRQKRVNQQLFDNIKQTISLLKNEYHLEESLAKVLILKLIFIRYLIDRKIKIDNKFIDGNENDVNERRRSLSRLIENPSKLASFFNYLNIRFNGVLFKDSNIELTLKQANLLSKLFKPDGVTQEEITTLFSGFDFQYEVFDFGIIPVELISGIYETLLDEDTKNATSAIYTPPFLVDYILTKTVDKYFEENTSTSECKIFDPAMGSGIFLVQGLRRMIERELEVNPQRDNDKFGNNIRGIAERNLFGIDINQEAINVACFSIYVALLDYQEPGDIDIYHFPNLKDNNFFKSNFFVRKIKDSDNLNIKEELKLFSSNLERIKNKKLNFILGNPPWKRNNSDYHIGWLNENNIYKKKEKKEKEIALSYLLRVNDFMDDDTVCSLIVTSTIFYNVSETIRFVKNKFFNSFSVQSILDLSSVRRLVFEGKKVVEKLNKKTGVIEKKSQKISSPALVIQYKKFNSEYSNLNPVHFKSVKANRFFNRLSKNLVIEKFDYKKILQKHFIQNNWMFKVALYGNTLDYMLFKKLEKHEKISSFFFKNGINKKDGFKRDILEKLSIKEDIENIDRIITEKEHIHQYFSPPIQIDNHVNINTEVLINLFGKTRIILKGQTKGETDLVVSYSKEKSLYRNDTFLIFSDHYEVLNLYPYFISKIYTYYQYLISSTWGIATRPAIRLDEEYLSFPFIEASREQIIELNSLTNSLIKPYIDFYEDYPNMIYTGKPNPYLLSNINDLINQIYQVNETDKDLIDYVLNVSRYQFQDSKQKLVSDFGTGIRNKKYVLENYASIYIKEFEKIYNDSFFKIEIYELDHFIAMSFIVIDEKVNNDQQVQFIQEINNEHKLFEKLSSLSISKIASNTNSEFNLFIQKDIKGFEENSFYVIKPKEYKCWHKAMAWYDVAEFKEAIQKSELERIQLRNE